MVQRLPNEELDKLFISNHSTFLHELMDFGFEMHLALPSIVLKCWLTSSGDTFERSFTNRLILPRTIFVAC